MLAAGVLNEYAGVDEEFRIGSARSRETDINASDGGIEVRFLRITPASPPESWLVRCALRMRASNFEHFIPPRLW